MIIVETAIALVLIFGALVMFHEFGHFLAARLFGIRVDEFAFGFGPKLITLLKRGDTEYTIHPIPLGGFVKLAGMEPGQEDVPDGFQAQAIWKRIIVIFCGPLASFILAVLVFLFLYAYWGSPDFTKPLNAIGMVSPQTEASRVGLKAGDKILKINGTTINEGKQMTQFIHKRPGERVTLLVDRNGNKTTKTATPQWTIQYLGITWSFMSSFYPVADMVLPVSEGNKYGIEKGDKLISINGEKISRGQMMTKMIKANDGKKAKLTLERNGKTITKNVTPSVEWVGFTGAKWSFPGGYAEAHDEIHLDKAAREIGIQIGDQIVSIDGVKINSGKQMLDVLNEKKNKEIVLLYTRESNNEAVKVQVPSSGVDYSYYNAIGLLGFVPQPSIEKMGFSEAITKGLIDTWEKVGFLLQTLTSKKIKDDVGGPILIAQATASSVALGPYWVFQMLGGLSLSLAFINLVPIPAVLDGGHILLLGIEAVRRKRFTPNQMATMQMAGLTIIGVLIIMIMFSDISKIISGNLPQ